MIELFTDESTDMDKLDLYASAIQACTAFSKSLAISMRDYPHLDAHELTTTARDFVVELVRTIEMAAEASR